jgi:predicted ATPase/DNA-binding XRE family transcriptional regulator
MTRGTPGSFGAHLKALREAAGFTQEELAAISGISVHAVSALERGERKRPHVETVRALSAALDLTGASRDTFLETARSAVDRAAVDEIGGSLSLPLPLTALIGRDGDVQTLRQWLGDPAVRLVTLTGPGGVGKTRLAIEVARGLVEHASQIVFVPLAPIRDPAFVPSTIAEAFGLSDLAASDLPRGVRVACADRPAVLVLDNFEQLLEATPVVAALLSSVPSLKLLVTSRAPLHIRGEREYAVRPLALDANIEPTSAADLAREPAVRLFVERVRDVLPEFRLTAANGPTVAAICRRLDALPLALELAAPWMKVLTADSLLERLEQDALLMNAGSRDLPERQQTMNATVAWSYQLLAAGEQHAFRCFGVLPGRFPLEAARAVLGGDADVTATPDAALGAVASLIDKSLLLREEGSTADRPLYRMFETVRAYAWLACGLVDDRAVPLDGLIRYAVREAAVAELELVGPAQAEWLDRVHDDLDTYRAALTSLLDRGRIAEASDIAWGLVMFWLIRGHVAEGLRWYQRILDQRAESPLATAKAFVGAAMMLYAQGEVAQARTALTSGMPLAHRAGDYGLIASAETLFGHVEHAVGNVDAARDRFVRGADGFKALGVSWGAGSAFSGRGGVELATGHAELAEQLLNEATSLLSGAGPWFLTPVLCFRAVLAMQRANPDKAIAHVRESLTYIRRLRDKYAFVYSLLPLAAAAMLKGDDAWTARILGARDAVIERTGVTVVVKMVNDLERQAEREVRARLGPDRWAHAYDAGRKTSIDALLKDIDRILERA